MQTEEKAHANKTATFCNFSVLRDLRNAHDMSIAELSEKSGISSSIISKLERNLCVPEMKSLYRIARTFGMTLTDLVALAENRMSHQVNAQKYKNGIFDFERVVYNNMRCMHAFAPAGAKLSAPELHRDDYELCWVLNGKLLFRLPDESHELTVGQSIQFDALLPHSYEALENTECIIVHLKKPKRF